MDMPLEQYHSKIFKIAEVLFQEFSGDVLCFFKNQNLQYFDRKHLKQFIATPTLPGKIKNIYTKNYVELNFFCGSFNMQLTPHKTEFFNTLNKIFTRPVFFLSPYFSYEASSQKADEGFYTSEFEFHFYFKIYPTRVVLNVVSRKNDEYASHITFKIKNILKQKNTHRWNSAQSPYGAACPAGELALLSKPDLARSIDALKMHMNQGDCYLANITQTKTLSQDSFLSFFNFIKKWLNKPTRYGVYFENSKIGLACFSPERFILCQDNVVVCEPIKGTYPVGEPHTAAHAAHKLWKNKKEIYENTLVTDLIRNDLNAFCVPGSVHVFKPFRAYLAGPLLQMQSTVFGQKEPTTRLGECLSFMLPAGSVTGTPKKRVCELIAQYESQPRGYYTGVCGVMEPTGNYDSCVLIRSVYKGKRGVYAGVGAGITALSETQAEIEECEAKLHSFLSPAKANV